MAAANSVLSAFLVPKERRSKLGRLPLAPQLVSYSSSAQVREGGAYPPLSMRGKSSQRCAIVRSIEADVATAKAGG